MKYLENKTVVVPFDFSEIATEAVHQVVDQLAEPSTRVHVLYVVVPTPAFVSYDPAIPMPPSFDQERSSQALQQMSQQFAGDPFSGLTFQTVIGDAGSEIVDYANKLEADLIVMPSHGRQGLERWMLGSVAERVTRLASCPVLVLRPSQSGSDGQNSE